LFYAPFMDNIFTGTLDNFKELVGTQDKVIIVDFYAEWCGPCRGLSVAIDAVAEKYGEIMVIKVDVDKNGELGRSAPYNVKGIPQMFFIKNGEVMEKTVGLQSIERISSLIDPLLN